MPRGKVRIARVGKDKPYLRVSIPESYLAPYGLEIGKKYQWKYSNGLLYLTPVNNPLEYEGVKLLHLSKQAPRIALPIAIAVAFDITIEKKYYDIVPYAGFFGIRVV